MSIFIDQHHEADGESRATNWMPYGGGESRTSRMERERQAREEVRWREGGVMIAWSFFW